MAVDPVTATASTLAVQVSANGGVAARPQLDWAYVTAPGPDGHLAIWAISLRSCRQPLIVETDAELPSVGPERGDLGFVTLDHYGRQTGVALTAIGSNGRPTRPVKRFPASSVPPPLPIMGIAVDDHDGQLAVWGGFIDSYLGRSQPTVGILDTSTATSMQALTPVFDSQGISIPATPGPAGRERLPKTWQTAPVYLPNGEFLVGFEGSGSKGTDISMPYSNTGTGMTGGGIRLILSDVGTTRSVAAGPNGALAWVTKSGALSIADNAIDLPFGPGAETPPRLSNPPARKVSGKFTSVAWGIPAEDAPPVPKPFQLVAHLPSVVGLSEEKAAAIMAAIGLPVFVGHQVVNATVPPDTVLAQDPPAGIGVAWQCAVALTVSTANS